uniref:Uncharacterized protein n=1 Tax=Oryza meridionalis TaxID=40149 RepID=A0A0E0CMS4_9ORYZ
GYSHRNENPAGKNDNREGVGRPPAKIDYRICFIIYLKYGSVTVLGPLDYHHKTANNYYKKKSGKQILTREKLLIHIYWPIIRDLCHFIHRECCHVKGRFFDPESILATREECKNLGSGTTRCHNVIR